MLFYFITALIHLVSEKVEDFIKIIYIRNDRGWNIKNRGRKIIRCSRQIVILSVEMQNSKIK